MPVKRVHPPLTRALIVALLTVGLTLSLFAAPAAMAQSTQTGQVLIFGEAHGRTSLEVLNNNLPWVEIGSLTAAMQTEAIDEVWAHTLASALVGARSAGVTRGGARCQAQSGSFSTHLESARSNVRFQLLPEAEADLSRAHDAFFCGEEIASRDDLWELLFLMGVAQVYGGGDKNPRERFQQAISIDPARPVPDEYEKVVKDNYARARSYMENFPPIAVSLPGNTLAPMSLYLNGEAVSDGYALLHPGTHHLQMVDPLGVAIRGMQIYVAATSDGSPPQLLPAELRPEPPGEVMTSLELGVSSGTLEPLEEEALRRVMAWQGAPWLVLAAPLEVGGGAKVFGLFPDEPARLFYIRVATPHVEIAEPERTRRLAPALTLTSGSLAVLAGGAAGYLFYATQDAAFDLPGVDDERRLATGLAAGAGGMAALATVTGICWGVQNKRRKEGDEQARVTFGQGPGALISVRW